jgi:hypothetical protein
MSAAVLSAGTEQLALVAAFGERANNARAARPGMPSILLERKGEVLSDEFRTRNPTLASRPREDSTGATRQASRTVPRAGIATSRRGDCVETV